MQARFIQRAFTLIELLVVIGVIAILMAVLIPSLASAKSRSRTVVCAGNLRTLGLATAMYQDENNGFFFPYHITIATNPLPQVYWFGATTTSGALPRPLDKTQSPIASYTANLDQRMQCPDFPYNDPGYSQKFDQRAASYGYNVTFIKLPSTSTNLPPYNRSLFVNRTGGIFVFADGLQFDSNTRFNEAAYIQYTSPLTLSGFAHFRHAGQAQMVFLDDHVDSQPLAGPNYRTVAGASSGNLSPAPGSNSIYGDDLAGSP